jgi:hypothetical protein
MRQHRSRFRLRALLAVCLLATAAAHAASVTYPLRKSTNGRFLVDAAGVPFMLVGDSPQALMVNVSESEADTFFADRQAHGFNTVWIDLICTTYTGGRADASTRDGVDPFTALIPSTSSYDLGTPNEPYFAHVDRVLRLAANHGLLVLLDPIETGGFLDTLRDNGVSGARAYGRYLGQRYKNVDNILWSNGNDFLSWQTASDDAVVLEVARGILDFDTRHMHTVEFGYPSSSSLDDANWTSIVGLNSTYTYFPTYALLEQDYARANFRPNFLAEARYELEGASPSDLRRQEYWAMTSGATGQVYGNYYTWQFISGWQTHVDTPGAIQMAYLVALFGPRAWYALVPDTTHTLLTAGFGTYSDTGSVSDNDYATAARTSDGSLAIVYAPTVRSLTVNMARLSAPAVTRWYDPSNGTFVSIPGSPFANSGSRNFTPPGNNAAGDGDWVLILETSHSCTNGTPCDDGNLCTVNETCTGGVCGGGDALDCGGGQPCSVASCDPISGCSPIHADANLDTSESSANRIDGRDLKVLADAWGSCPGDGRYDPSANLDLGSALPESCIDLTDFHLFMAVFGHTCN